MAKISAATDHALSVIAHVAMAGDLSKKVVGMEKFYDFYLNQLSVGDKAIFQRFQTLHKQAHRDFADMIEKERKADGL